jgi:hypothetical protein
MPGIPTDGEAWIVSDLQELLDEAMWMLDTLKETQTTQQATEQLAKLEELLADPAWESADQIETDLLQKKATQQELIVEMAEQIAEWRSQIEGLEDQLKDALRTRAPVTKERSEVTRLKAIAERADQALRNQDFPRLIETIPYLEDSQAEPQVLVDEIQRKVEQVGPFANQADLLMLRSPLVEQTYQYTVLLRTPSEPGSHGINIQDASNLSMQDRQQMRETVDSVTQRINAGLVRQFELRQQQIKKDEDTATQDEEESDDTIEPQEENLEVSADAEQQDDNEADEQLRDVEFDEILDPAFAPLKINDLAQDIGDFMYRLFMPPEMRDYLNETDCSITITTNDLELPWELMWKQEGSQNGKFLCLERPVGRMPMGQVFPRRELGLPFTGGEPRFLLIHADPSGNLPSAGREIRLIKKGLEERWEGSIIIDVLSREDAEGRRLNEVLRSGTYDVIHYAGHAAFDEDEPDLSALLLHKKEVFYAQKVRRLLEGRPLVFLNACESGRTANEENAQEIDKYLQRPAAGLASSFIYGGARGCIGALWPVYDRPAAEFAIHFYNRVLEGYMIGEAMRLARLHIKEAYPNQITWASFVLYGDPTIQLT